VAEKMIYKALIECMRGIGSIGKDKMNSGQHYKFRGIDDVYNAANPVFAKNGVLCLPEVLTVQQTERKSAKGGLLIYTTMRVKHTFIAEDGSSVECVTAGEAMDSGDKSSNKAMSAALKYAIFETLMIPTEEKLDTEYDSPQLVAKAPPKAAVKPDVDMDAINKEIAGLCTGRNNDALCAFMIDNGALPEGKGLMDLLDKAKIKLVGKVDSVIHSANEFVKQNEEK